MNRLAEPKTARPAPSTLSAIGKTSPTSPQISVILPVLNERENLKKLADSIEQILVETGRSFEVIFVDDGSDDGSSEVLADLAESGTAFRSIHLARTFGQTAALAAGFEHARGTIIITLDADLQNDPADIPQLLEKLDEGYDVVSCWRKNRRDAWLTRVLPSQLANRLASWISGVKLHDFGCTLKGYRRELLQHVHLYGEMHRFIPIFASWAGARVTEIPVEHQPRQWGDSKYGISRSFKVLLDLITIKFLGSFSTKPMYLFGGLGLLSFLSGSLLAVLTLYQKFVFSVKAHRNPILLLSIFCFLIGTQFVLTGLVAELIMRTYHESQNKPIYIIKTLHNFHAVSKEQTAVTAEQA